MLNCEVAHDNMGTEELFILNVTLNYLFMSLKYVTPLEWTIYYGYIVVYESGKLTINVLTSHWIHTSKKQSGDITT